MQNRRRIPLSGTENTRDLGGYPAGIDASGTPRMTRYGVFLRSGVPSGLSEADIALLHEMRIHTIIDLRSLEECMRTPCHFAELPGFSYHHLHLDGDGPILPEIGKIGASYLSMTRCDTLPQLFHILAQMQGGCLFHCTAGKDRTGTVAAILLLVAGVAEADIIADYSLSYPYLSRLIRSLKADYPDLPAYVGRSDPEAMESFLQLFKQQYGTAEQFLKGLRLTDAELTALRNKLVCSAG